MKLTYAEYTQRYGTSRVTEAEFPPLSYEACRIMAIHTTGIDGYRKLEWAFPYIPYDAEAVVMCACKIVDILWQINTAEESARLSRGTEETANGYRGKAISSMSAGNESVSYENSASSGGTSIDKAVADSAARKVLMHDIITEGLSGVSDAHGVNLLYMGVYPKGLREDV